MAASLAKITAYFNRVKVVHHLPGRLRLDIPWLERLNPEWLRYESDLVAIIKRKQGLVSIDFSTISGRALIHYDPHRITRTQMMQWFRKVALMLCEGYAEAPFKSERQLAPFLKRMRSQSRLWL